MKIRNKDVSKRLNILHKAATNKIQINRNERFAMVQVLQGGTDVNSEMKVFTMTLESNFAFKLKQEVNEVRKRGDSTITLSFTEAWVVTLNSKTDTLSSYHLDGNLQINLKEDKIRLMTGDTIKSWNKMKSGFKI